MLGNSISGTMDSWMIGLFGKRNLQTFEPKESMVEKVFKLAMTRLIK